MWKTTSAGGVLDCSMQLVLGGVVVQYGPQASGALTAASSFSSLSTDFWLEAGDQLIGFVITAEASSVFAWYALVEEHDFRENVV